MSELFIQILNMSISSCWLILAVLCLRLALKKAPKWVRILLWGLVAVRLLCPFSIESALSLIPASKTISPEIMLDATPTIATGISTIDAALNPVISQSSAPDPTASVNPLQVWFAVAANIWVIGIIVMLLHTAVSYLRLRKKVATAVRLRDNIYQSENVVSPFVLGIFKPRIYLPFQISLQNMYHVITHEQAHIRRKDHWWKPLGFLLLTVHWFNPFAWLAYILLCRDIELACDERVIKALDVDARADYSAALLSCSVSRRMIAACPIAFGEVSVKTRIKSVLSYKKPAFWVILVALILCVVVAVCFLTNPIGSDREPDLSFLNYENAISLVADRETVQVIHYPTATDQTESFIKLGTARGNDLAYYLDSCRWREVHAPQNSLSSPGSIEFVIEDEYRITVYDRKDWSFRSYAKVTYQHDVRYYSIGYSDYEDALTLIMPESDRETVTDGNYYLKIGTEGVTKIRIDTPDGTQTQRNVLGLPFEKGQEVRLELLDGVTDLRGVSLTAFNKSGEIVYAFSVPQGATNTEVINTVASDGWLLAPTVAIGAEADGQYYHFISSEGVAELKLTGTNFSGGCVPADGSTFRNGERVWLEPLDGFTDLQDVTVTALDKDGNVLYSFLLVPGKSEMQTIIATILEIQDGRYLVESASSIPEKNSYDRFIVPIKNAYLSPEPRDGDMIEVKYTGPIASGYPAQIDDVISIRVLLTKQNGELIHVIPEEGITEIEISTASFSGGCVTADGSAFPVGHEIDLEQLVDFADLTGATIRALDKHGNILYSFSWSGEESEVIAQETEATPENDYNTAFSLNFAGNLTLDNHMVITEEMPYWQIVVTNDGPRTIKMEIAGEVYQIKAGNTEIICSKEAWKPGSYSFSFSTSDPSGMSGNAVCKTYSQTAGGGEANLGDRIPMVMVDGILYRDTGRESTAVERNDGFDGEITSTVNSSEKPTVDDQSNFGTGYGYQYSYAEEKAIEVYMNGKWWVFTAEKTE